MRPSPPAAHLLATLAVTAAALVTAFFLPVPAEAATPSLFGADTVGSGRSVALARPVGRFTALRLEGPVDIDAHPGAAPGATVHADDNVEPLVETVVEGETLVVRLRHGANFRSEHRTFVEVSFPALAATRQTGSGDLHVTRIDGPRLDAAIAGSGDLRIDEAALGDFTLHIDGSGDAAVAGHAAQARYVIAGSGDIDAARLVARRVDVDVVGSGDVRANATEAIDARVTGSGDVVYEGRPHDVSRRVTGSGSIRAAH